MCVHPVKAPKVKFELVHSVKSREITAGGHHHTQHLHQGRMLLPKLALGGLASDQVENDGAAVNLRH